MLGQEVVGLWARCAALSKVEGQSVPRRAAVDGHSNIPVAEYSLIGALLEHTYECRHFAKEYEGDAGQLQKQRLCGFERTGCEHFR